MFAGPRATRASWLLSIALGATSAAAAGAQSVLLEIRPRVGDTLHIRLDQQTEQTRRRRVKGADVATTIVETMRLYSRAIVEGSVPNGTYVRTVTDSVRLFSSDERARSISAEAQRTLEGQSLRLRVSPDGSVSIADTAAASPAELSEVVSLMPAAFPRGAIAVGYTWAREMPLPGANKVQPGGGAAGGWLHARFRLDSVSQRGGIAYVSMRGEMTPDPDSKLGTDGSGSTLEHGEVSGTMLVDRHRGWLTASQFTIIVHSLVQLPGAADAIMRFETRVTQKMRTVEKR